MLPVLKHIPGHGRARVDSHYACPLVETGHDELSRTDFAPFRALDAMPWAMTAHIVYRAIDPTAPATLSPRVIGEIIRGEIGFDGVLVSDDLSMRALGGGLAERTRARWTPAAIWRFTATATAPRWRRSSRRSGQYRRDAARIARGAAMRRTRPSSTGAKLSAGSTH